MIVTDNTTMSLKPRHKYNDKHHRRLQSGQNLLEGAISFVILLLLVAGLVDLARAFFAKVALDGIASEGANWAAAYPGCIPTASDATDAPQIPPECRGTNSIIGRAINANPDFDRSRIASMTIDPVAVQKSQEFTLTITYRLPVVTPVIQVLFGDSLQLTSQVREVVRGEGMPSFHGSSMADQGRSP